MSLTLAGLLMSGPDVAARETFPLQVQHTLLARQALLGDSQLADLNLGIKVQNRVVTLWGPVPSAVLARRAENLLRTLPDFLDVYNDLQIDDQLLAATPPGPPGYLPEALPKTITAPGPPAAALPEIGFIPLPIPDEKSMPAAGPGSPGVLTTRPVAKAPPPLPTLSWQPVTAFPVVPAMPATIIQANAPPRNAALEKALHALQQGRTQYRSLQIEVTGNTVFLRGSTAQGNALHDFSRLAARVPGVDRVVVLNP